MKLQFNQNLSHQKSAWEAVVSLFEGQESCSSPFTMPQLVAPTPQGAAGSAMSFDFGQTAELGTANRLVLSEEELLDNQRQVLRVVFRDTSFIDDITKTNAIQHLKQASIEDVLSI